MNYLALLLVSQFWIGAVTAFAAERDYQKPWCQRHGGIVEHVLPDRTRVDCLTATHAVEFDFGKKWAEAIGQALYYARMTGLKAGIVLIVLDDSDRRGLVRLKAVIEEFKLPVDLWIVN